MPYRILALILIYFNQNIELTSSQNVVDGTPPLFFTEESSLIIVSEGSSVILPCYVNVQPIAQYSWFKNGEEIQNDLNVSFRILKTVREDAGQYRCIAANTFGRLKSRLMELKIGCESTHFRHKVQLFVFLYETITLIWLKINGFLMKLNYSRYFKNDSLS